MIALHFSKHGKSNVNVRTFGSDWGNDDDGIGS